MVEVAKLKKFGVLSMFSDLQLECLAKVAEIKAVGAHSQNREPCRPSEWLSLNDVTHSWRYTLADICLGDSEVLSINAEGLFDLWEVDPHVGHALVRQLALLYLQVYANLRVQVDEALEQRTVEPERPGECRT